MFKKKQKQPDTEREPAQQPYAKVFSYYSSRSPSGATAARRTDPTTEDKKKNISFGWLIYAPTFLATILLLGCMVYVTTLDTKPKVRFVGSDPNQSLVSDPVYYQSGIKSLLDSSITNRSKLLIDTNKLASEINQQFPELGEVVIVLPMVGRQPIVEAKPADAKLILVSANDTFIIDENGLAIALSKDVESSARDNLPIVVDETDVQIERGKAAITSEAVKLISEVYSQFAEKQIQIQSASLPISASELRIRLDNENYYIKFDLRGDGKLQAGTFIAMKDYLDEKNVAPKEYVDVRVPGKAFYK